MSDSQATVRPWRHTALLAQRLAQAEVERQRWETKITQYLQEPDGWQDEALPGVKARVPMKDAFKGTYRVRVGSYPVIHSRGC